MIETIITKCEGKTIKWVEPSIRISLELYYPAEHQHETISIDMTSTDAKNLADLLSKYTDNYGLCFHSHHLDYNHFWWNSPKTVRWCFGRSLGVFYQEFEFGTGCMVILASVIHTVLRGSDVPDVDKETDLMAGANRRRDDNLRKVFG